MGPNSILFLVLFLLLLLLCIPRVIVRMPVSSLFFSLFFFSFKNLLSSIIVFLRARSASLCLLYVF